MALDVFFQGIASPARIIGAEGLIDLLPNTAFGWPYRVAKSDASASCFYTISADPGSDLLLCQNHLDVGKSRRLDHLNALCDLFAALALSLPASDPNLICLHAAAVRVSGQLLIFPNVRRAGKSTLSVALSMAGHGLVGDDVVPLSFDAEGRALAHALGISPRLRLPLPDAAPPDFRARVESAEGERNRQYQYVRLPDQPTHGTRIPVAAFVILDRLESPVPARIMPVSGDKAMDALLYQNFSRDRHSGDVLHRVAGMLAVCPAFVLTYSDLEDAVRCLEAGLAGRSGPKMAAGTSSTLPFRLAELRSGPVPALSDLLQLQQRAGTEAQMIGNTLYLADADGKAIHRLDPLATTIWDLLAEPATRKELVAILSEAFAETDTLKIAADLDRLLQRWARAGLIAAARDG